MSERGEKESGAITKKRPLLSAANPGTMLSTYVFKSYIIYNIYNITYLSYSIYNNLNILTVTRATRSKDNPPYSFPTGNSTSAF